MNITDECAVDGCHRERRSREWCHKHYERWRRRGTLETKNSRAPLMTKILDRIQVDRSGCLLWTGRLNGDGYAVVYAAGKEHRVHKAIWEHKYGPVTQGNNLDHLCRVRRCVNHRHLEEVSIGENTLRGNTITAKNLQKSTCAHGHTYDKVYRTTDGRRYRGCSQCDIRRSREYRKRQTARRST